MTEIRLVAMRFVPDENGGQFKPVADPLSSFPMVDAWENGLTAEEAEFLFARVRNMPHPELVPDDHPIATGAAKLRAPFQDGSDE